MQYAPKLWMWVETNGGTPPLTQYQICCGRRLRICTTCLDVQCKFPLCLWSSLLLSVMMFLCFSWTCPKKSTAHVWTMFPSQFISRHVSTICLKHFFNVGQYYNFFWLLNVGTSCSCPVHGMSQMSSAAPFPSATWSWGLVPLLASGISESTVVESLE